MCRLFPLLFSFLAWVSSGSFHFGSSSSLPLLIIIALHCSFGFTSVLLGNVPCYRVVRASPIWPICISKFLREIAWILIVALVFAIYWGSVSSTEGLLLIKFRRRLHYVVVVVPWKIRVVTPPWIVCTREGIVAKSMLVLLLPIIVGNEVDSLL